MLNQLAKGNEAIAHLKKKKKLQGKFHIPATLSPRLGLHVPKWGQYGGK